MVGPSPRRPRTGTARLRPMWLVVPHPRTARARALRPAMATLAILAAVWLLAFGGIVPRALAAGPPFPDPAVGQRVYDTAGVLRADTIAHAETQIATIEARTGAQIAVYTQVVGYGVTTDEARSDALALMNQWGVGRKGFDDGLVILFDLDPSRVHGQVQLYAGAGFRSAFLSDADRQSIYEGDMLPRLRDGDLNGALLVALDRVDAAATPEHAAALDRARQLDAVLGLLVGPLVALLLVGWAVLAWLRHGRDPVYLDDPSIHMPAPPPDLTPATGALIMAGRSNRRALTAAMLDLASRGTLAFREESRGILKRTKVGIEVDPQAGTDTGVERERANARRLELGPAEAYALDELRGLAVEGYIDPVRLTEFGSRVSGFDERLEGHATDHAWFAEKPGSVTNRWLLRGGLELAAGIGLVILGANIPSAGLVVAGVLVAVAGVVTLLLAPAMPARTMPGAMIRAMLAAYRRTLEKTMAQARSMQQVVEESGLAWIESPDRAVVWGVALGLDERIEAVLARSIDDLGAGRARPGVYLPAWYLGSGGGPSGSMVPGGGGGGMFSSSAIPNFGGMMAALGTIGNAPASSGGGGGFGGGGGGGGGGAGGGF